MCSPSWSPLPPPSPPHPSGSSQCTSRIQFWVKLVSALRPTSFSCLFPLRFSSGTPTPYTGKNRLFFFLPCWPLGVSPGRSLPGFFLWALGTLWPSAHPLGGLAPTYSIITFLPRSKRLLVSWLQSPSAVILEPQKIKSDTVSTVSPSVSHEVIGSDAMILVFWMLSFKPTFSFSSSLSSRGFLAPLHFLP